jgi:chorismate-pyruvate lyase
MITERARRERHSVCMRTACGFRESLVEWQDTWSPAGEHEAWRVAALPALQRLLLTTDGTTTAALAMLVGEPIGVRLLCQHTTVLALDDDELSLCAGDVPIGLVLREHQIETFRVPLRLGVKPASDEAAHHLGAAPMCWRRYLIKTGNRPLMSVDEQFPAAGFAASR